MKPLYAGAVAEFLERGGEIQKLENPRPVTEQELLDYLASCELRVKYFPGTLNPYSCSRRPYSLHGLLRLANNRRRAQQLTPMTL